VTAPADPDTYVGLADAIADLLAETVIVAGERCTWLHANVEESDGVRSIVHRTGDPSVYQGDAGIAWALAQVAVARDRAELRGLALAAAASALRRADAGAGRGLHDGTTGIAIATFQVATALGEPQLAEAALGLLDEATSRPLPSEDVIGGNAGAVMALLAAHEENGEEWLLERALSLGQVLVETAERRTWGWHWASAHAEEPGLLGLAHGAAGIAWALAELAAQVDDESLDTAVRNALRHERSWFDRRHNNWPDLRVGTLGSDGKPSFPIWWCHGSVGGGLVRLRLHELGREEPILLAEAGAALQSSVADSAISINDGRLLHYGLTTCHGLGGAIELLLVADAVLGESEHLTTARWLLDRAVTTLGDDVEGWPDGVGSRGASPGLMTGMAGTLVVLLRAAGLGQLPSVGLFPSGGGAAASRSTQRVQLPVEATTKEEDAAKGDAAAGETDHDPDPRRGSGKVAGRERRRRQ
jgi:lantibiotic modifying enzyme